MHIPMSDTLHTRIRQISRTNMIPKRHPAGGPTPRMTRNIIRRLPLRKEHRNTYHTLRLNLEIQWIRNCLTTIGDDDGGIPAEGDCFECGGDYERAPGGVVE